MELTEEMILTRSSTQNLNCIRKLNLWGCDLADVSLLEKLPNLEVLVLNENRIRSLKGFRQCLRMQGLYLRSNDIQDFDELIYLKNLPLKSLVLANNPLCEKAGDGYRINVIKILPFLECLDNENVKDFEHDMALSLRISDRKLKAPQQLLGSESVLSQRSSNGFDVRQQCPELVKEREPKKQYPASESLLDQYLPKKIISYFENPNRAFAKELRNVEFYNTLPCEAKRNSYNNPNNANYRSNMDLSEWEKKNLSCGSKYRLRAGSVDSSSSLRTNRTVYKSRDDITSDCGYASPRSSCRPTKKQRMPFRQPFDSESVESNRTSSIASSNQGKISYPRSRQVNLLCASLRFILELDALTLVDVLSIIRARIAELYEF